MDSWSRCKPTSSVHRGRCGEHSGDATEVGSGLVPLCKPRGAVLGIRLGKGRGATTCIRVHRDLLAPVFLRQEGSHMLTINSSAVVASLGAHFCLRPG